MNTTLGLSGILIFAFRLSLAGSSLIELPAVRDPALLLFHPGCVIRYNRETLQPDWVAYRLTAEEVRATEAVRSNVFRPDPELINRVPSARDSDYAKTGYDRGHLAPAADMKSSKGAMLASFFLSNISPQYPSLNRGIWSRLEESVRGEALKYGAVYIASGPIFYTDRITGERVFIGANRLPVPDAFFKVLLVKNETESRAIAFILPNGEAGSEIIAYACSIDEAEIITGYDFFNYLSDESESRLESEFDTALWFKR